MNQLWNDIAARASVTLDKPQHSLLNRYIDLLTAGNKRMNLTRITDRDAAELNHIADSLTLLAHLPAGPLKLADVGSGGGVPGLPLAIVRPDIRVVLIEATGKKADFLKSAVGELGLSNVKVMAERAEDAGHSPMMRESCDVAVARAVATLSWLVEWCLPLVKVRGRMLAMKGQRIADELPTAAKAIQLLGGGKTTVHPVELPGADHHVIVEIVKAHGCDERFPRSASTAKGKPI